MTRPTRPVLLALTTLVTTLLALPAATSPARADNDAYNRTDHSAGHRDDDNVAVIVGPKELEESGLIGFVIDQYLQDYPFGDDIGFRYVGTDTAAEAVELARSGDASVLIVDAPELERRFDADGLIADGYDDEPGHGIPAFWTDTVLLGAKADPAGVRSRSPYDLVTALERVAALGNNGRAEFVSRGEGPDATAIENALWARTDGIRTCRLTAARGGGQTPSRVTGPCPTRIPRPAWFHDVGADQTTTVRKANHCAGYRSRACYTLSDRGVSTRLSADERIDGLRLVGRDDEPTRRDLTVRSYRAISVAPNRYASDSFVGIMTDETQLEIAGYLGGGSGVGPYRRASKPRFTASTNPRVVPPGGTFVASGYLSSREPGAARLGGIVVDLQRATDSSRYEWRTVAQARTDARGVFRIRYAPGASGYYRVATDDADHVVDPQAPPYVVTYVRGATNLPSVSVRPL